MTRRTFRLAIEGAAVSTLLALAVSFLLIRVLSLVPPLFPLLHPASTNAAAGSAARKVRREIFFRIIAIPPEKEIKSRVSTLIVAGSRPKININ